MPTYEYQCKTCGQHFERVQRFTDDPITECPTCGGVVKRVIHPAGVIFKGAGWYITDSRKSGGDSAALNNAPAATKTEGEATKTETKTEKKAESKPAEKAAPASDS